jgi:hypothetical protein
MIIAIAVVTLGIIFAFVKSRKRKNAPTSPGLPASELPTSMEKTVVGEGDLDADGSGTLGNPRTGNGTYNIDAEDFNIDEDGEDDGNKRTEPEVV